MYVALAVVAVLGQAWIRLWLRLREGAVHVERSLIWVLFPRVIQQSRKVSATVFILATGYSAKADLLAVSRNAIKIIVQGSDRWGPRFPSIIFPLVYISVGVSI